MGASFRGHLALLAIILSFPCCFSLFGGGSDDDGEGCASSGVAIRYTPCQPLDWDKECVSNLVCCASRDVYSTTTELVCTAANDCVQDVKKGQACSSHNVCRGHLMCDTDDETGAGTCRGCDEICSPTAGCPSGDMCVCCKPGEVSRMDGYGSCYCEPGLDSTVPDMMLPDKSAPDLPAPDVKHPDVGPDK